MPTGSPSPSASYACGKCGSANPGHALKCERCGAALLIECLARDCVGRNRPDANHCSTCGLNLVEFRLTRWRELDRLLEMTQEGLAGQNLGEALAGLQEILSEPHEEFQKVRDEARKLTERIADQDSLEKLASEAASQGNWDHAEQYLRGIALAFPEREDVPRLLEELQRDRERSEASQLESAKDAMRQAHELRDRQAYGMALRKADEALSLLSPSHPVVPKINDFVAQVRSANTLRIRKWLALGSAAIMVVLVAGYLMLASRRPSLDLARRVDEMTREVEENLRASEPPPWRVPDYSHTATETFRSPPALPDNAGRAFIREP